METFHVPNFRAATEKNLKEKMISDQDCRYIARTLATVLMGHVYTSKMSDCAVVAKALVAKYPLLADTGTKPHVSDTWSSFACMFLCLLYIPG